MNFLALQRTPLGFEPSGAATAFVGIPTARYSTPAVQAEFYTRVLEQLRANPQVTSATASLALPIAGFGALAPYSVQGRDILPLPKRPLAGLNTVSDDYFATLRIPMVEGRTFTQDDRAGAPGACVINQQLAKRLFPGESAIGKVLLRGRDAELANTVVGVIADIKSNGPGAPPPDEIYYSMRQIGKPGMSLSARTSGDPAQLQNIFRAAVATVDKDQPISFFTTFDAAMAQSLGVQRIVASLTSCFAAIALVLAAIGLYAVVAYAVMQRTNEIGIRMALGARPGQVLSLVMNSGMKLVAIGIVIGLAGAAGLANVIATQLASVQKLDPVVYLSVALFFGLIAALACLLPARRATRIDPVVALFGGGQGPTR
jgi:putative ABC transport system permease protein